MNWIAKSPKTCISSQANHVPISDSDFNDLMRIIIHVRNKL
jgi:hypothetical protein